MTDNANEQGTTRRVTPKDVRDAMATYSGDGQGDDATGGDALAEVQRARAAAESDDTRPTPDTGL
ncbi:hypothetical protein [Cryptosporangium aurantiacum]|nr:hypothetical protein [Cryptosporangium aurantiacum]